MSKKSTCGTTMFCKKCGHLAVCKAVEPKAVFSTLPSARRFYKPDHNDVHWFRRGRKCLTCNSLFLSAEIREDFLTELTELRDALGNLKKHAEAYKDQSEKATESLTALTESLDLLSALEIYQNQKVSR